MKLFKVKDLDISKYIVVHSFVISTNHCVHQLRVGLSKLNFHKLKHNFGDTVNQWRNKAFVNDVIET